MNNSYAAANQKIYWYPAVVGPAAKTPDRSVPKLFHHQSEIEWNLN